MTELAVRISGLWPRIRVSVGPSDCPAPRFRKARKQASRGRCHPAGDMLDLADPTVRQPPLRGRHPLQELPSVRDHQNTVSLPRETDEGKGVASVERHRFFAQHVEPVIECSRGVLEVIRVRRCDHHRVELTPRKVVVVLDEFLDPETSSNDPKVVPALAAQGPDVDVGPCPQGGQVVLGRPPSGSDDSDLDHAWLESLLKANPSNVTARKRPGSTPACSLMLDCGDAPDYCGRTMAGYDSSD